MRAAVRNLRKDDLATLLALYEHLHDDEAPAPSPLVLRSLWEQILADPSQIYLGAFVGGTLTAAANVAIIQNLTRGARPFAVVENVVTHSEYRRQGMGRAVLLELIKVCSERDCYKVMLMSGSGRESAHSFYRNVGFDSDTKHAFAMRL